MKQVIVIRKDLGMRAGKMIAQGAHASMDAILPSLLSPGKTKLEHRRKVLKWLSGSFTKVVLRVESEQELLDIYNTAKAEGLIASLIIDNGKTEFHGNRTATAVAIGPDDAERIDPITGHLKPL